MKASASCLLVLFLANLGSAFTSCFSAKYTSCSWAWNSSSIVFMVVVPCLEDRYAFKQEPRIVP